MDPNFANDIYYYLSLIEQVIPSDTNISTTNIVIPFFTPAVTFLDVLLDIVIIILCVILIIYPPNSQEQEQEQALPPETIQDIMNRVLLGIDHNDVDFFDDFDDVDFFDGVVDDESPPLYSIVDPNPPPAYPYLSPAQKRTIIGILNRFRQRRYGQRRNGGSLSGGGNIQISTFLKNTINVFKNEFKNIIIVNDQKEKKNEIITQVEKDIPKIITKDNDEKKKYFTHYCLLFLKYLKNNKEQLLKLKTKPLNAKKLQEITLSSGGGRKKKRTLRKKKKNKKKKSRRSRRLQSKKKSI